MKKHLLRSLFFIAALVMGAGSAWAITVTETYDFGAFMTAASGNFNATTGDEAATQSGTSEYTGGTVYYLNEPDNGSTKLSLNKRFAIDYGTTASQQIRFMWRKSGNAYQHGLAGQWNGNGAANTAAHLTILNLKEGDKITLTWAVQNGKPAQPFLCKSGVVTDVNADEFLASGTQYTIASDDNLDLYFKNNNFAISKVVIVTEQEGEETIGAPQIRVTGVDGINRIVTITPGVGTAGSQATATYYTTDGTEPSAENGTLYSAPFSIATTTVVKAISYLNTTFGPVQTQEIAAGEPITLNAPNTTITDMVANGDIFNAIINATNDQSNILLKPTTTVAATFNGAEITLPYTATEDGTLVVTVSATGYTSASTEVAVKGKYTLGTVLDFSALTAESFSDLWKSATGGLRDYWTNRAAAIPADATYYTLVDPSAETAATALEGVTFLNPGARQPQVYIGYGLYTPYDLVSGSGNYLNLQVNSTTADDVIIYEGWNNYGNGTFTTVQTGDKAFALYRYDTMLRKATIYTPVAPTEVTIDMTGAITDGESYYATFSNAKALDFTGVEGLTAYTGVKTDNVFLTLEEVTKVPANTGLFIKTTEAKTYTIPFAEGEVEAPAANDLIAAVDVVNSSTVTNAYELKDYGETYMGKYVYFRSIDAATEIPAGTAYLSLTDSEDGVAYGFVYVKFPAGPAAEVANIAALKAQDAENVTLTLNNTKITFANESYIVIEDATGGALLSLDALDDMLKPMMPMYAGYTFNGTLGLAFDPMVSLYGVADLSGMEVNTTAPAEPLAITAENVNAYTESYDWRWVKFAGATWTKETQSLNIKELEMDIPVQNLLGTEATMPEADATVDVEGYVYLLDLSIYGLGTANYFQPTKVTEVKDEPQTEERNWIIFEEVVEKDALAADAQFTNKAGDLVLTITDSDNKMSIDANNAYFGTAEKQDKFTHRLKVGGKSGSKNSMALTIPGKGTLKVYVRTASSSATDRNVVLTQNSTELYNKVVLESDAVEVDLGGENPTRVYPVISVAVVAGKVDITYPIGALNFYGFEFIDETETGITTVNTEVKAANGVYNLRGQKVENMVKGQLYIINGKKVMIK